MVVFRAALPVALAALLSVAAPAQSTPKPAPPSVVPSAAQTARARRIAQIIQNVEVAYQNGMSNYHDGHLAAAKDSFDYAVDQMLTCGLSIKDNPDLTAEFDRIVDAVNTLEMDALKQGNGLAPPSEPTPVDVANAVTFPVDPTIRAEATAQLKTTRSDLPLVINDYVASYINFFSKSKAGHATIVASLDRAGRYKDMIERVLKQEGVPQDLIYQAVAESGFRPQVVNRRSGAGGMWQFMPGDDHAPPRSAWYDERFDPVAATHAYAKYMKYLYSQFGDWYLAMAAYDWGAGNVQKAVQRTGFADFWELYKRNNLPAETKNYVPIILAVTIMAKNPKQYGLDDLTPDPPLVEDTVQTNHSVGLALAADLVGATPQELAALNPALLRGATPPDETYNLHLPAGTKALFEKRIAGIPADKRHYWRYQTLADNETLEDVAKKYHVSLASLEEVNDLSSAADISDVDAVVVPVTPRSASLGASYYRVRRGDTLISIADRFNVSVEQLRAWNHLRGPYIRVGHRLRVAEPAHVERSRSSRRRSSHHTTRRSRTRHSASHKTRKGK
ncbi:MAG TPA: transglycosylase SLT domain-containing protein [Acidobacteriaceae bacterium]|jgi:membrane-bound lytic murein transglycosylase D|nr:transglycosylase SLT domain-containing protein [Acidobacteriaceae bacterium]